MSTSSERPKSRALLIVQQERSVFGLRSNDYVRYRKHCTSKISTLRRSLKLTHGKGKEFKKLSPISPGSAEDGHLQLLLFEAERCYAYSQEIISSSPPPTGSERRHGLARLRRAVHYSEALTVLARSMPDSRVPLTNLAELITYHLILSSRFAMARLSEEANDTLIKLSTARTILSLLAEAAPTSRDVALYTSFSDELSAEIRFCAHELGHPRPWDIDAVVADVSQDEMTGAWDGWTELRQKLELAKGTKNAVGAKQLKPLVWEGKPVPIRNPELVDVLLKVQDAEVLLEDERAQLDEMADDNGKYVKGKGRKKKSRGRIAGFDGLLHALSDAEDVSRRLVEAQQATTSSSATSSVPAASQRDIYFVHSYIVYRLLSSRIQRDLLLVSLLSQDTVSSPKQASTTAGSSHDTKSGITLTAEEERIFAAVVKLLDTVLQSSEQMRALSVVEESEVLATGVDARLSFTRAKRIYYLARIYASLKQYGEAIALLGRGSLYLREALSIAEDFAVFPELGFYPLSSSEAITPLQETISSLELSLKKAWFAYDRGGHPEQPKPVFYDIAFNYVQYPKDRLRARAGKAPLAPVDTGKRETGMRKEQVDEQEENAAAQPVVKSVLSSYLGSWWGRR